MIASMLVGIAAALICLAGIAGVLCLGVLFAAWMLNLTGGPELLFPLYMLVFFFAIGGAISGMAHKL